MEKVDHRKCLSHHLKDSITKHSCQSAEFEDVRQENVGTVYPHEEGDSMTHLDGMVQSTGDLNLEESSTTATSKRNNHVTTTSNSSLLGLAGKSDKSTIFVGNLPYKVTWQDLKAFFSKFGDVTYAKIVKDVSTNRSKGYGFIQFSGLDDAHRAINASPEELCLFGRALRVNPAQNTPTRRKTRQEGVGGHGQMAPAQDVSHINRLTDDSLVHVFEYLTPLELFTIERVSKRWRECALVAARQKRCLTLTRLCLFAKCGGFHNLMSRCCHLVSLDISSVAGLLGDMDPLKVIATFGKHIERLNISGVDSSNRSLEILAKQCTQLKSLTVKNCSRKSDKGFQSVFKLCKNLEHLDCTGSYWFTGKCLKHATSAFRSLQASGCARLTNSGILNLVKKCPLMETLRIEKCSQLVFETISQLTKSLPGLKVLCCGNWHRQQLQANSARHFVHHFVNPGIIVELKLVNCSLLDDHLQLICDRCPLISHLDISCNILTDVSIIQLAALKHLQYLSACDLSRITDVSLENVARHGQLRQLLVQSCYKLTDRLMQIVAENCVQLEELDVAMIPSISVVSLSSFRQSCLRRASTSQLHIYTSGNNFDHTAAREYSNPPTLYIYDNYRPLYSRLLGIFLHAGDLLDFAGGGDHNILVRMLSADLVDFDDSDSDDNFVCSDDGFGDDFLDNDDFLAQERWNLS